MSVNYKIRRDQTTDDIIINDSFTIPKYSVLPNVQPIGSIIYNTTDNKLYKSNGIIWSEVGVSGSLDPALESIASLTTNANEMIYTIAGDTYQTTPLTSFARSLLDDTTSNEARSTLGLAINTDVQAFDPSLQSISMVSTIADQILYTTAPETFAATNLSTFGRNFIAQTDSTNARSALGLGTISVLNAPAGDVVGTTDIQTLTNKTITGNTNTIDASGLLTNAGTSVQISGTLPPSIGQFLIATSANTAIWQTFTAGDVSSSGLSTDNAIVRFDSTTGKLIQNSNIIIDDLNNITGINTIDGTLITSAQPNITSVGSLSSLNVINNITLGGLVDGVDIALLKTDVDGFPDRLKFLTTAEIQQLENINTTNISTPQWGYLGDLNQPLSTTDTPTFNGLSANNQKITNLGTPTLNTDAATKLYVDTLAGTGLNAITAGRVATTTILPNSPTYTATAQTLTSSVNIAISIDSVSLILNDRVLVKDQADNRENGVYFVSQVGDGSNPWILTRSTDFNQSATPIPANTFILITEGTINVNTSWLLSSTINTIDPLTDSVIFNQFSSSQNITAGDGLVQVGNDFNVVGTSNRITALADSIDIASTYVGQTSITTLGTISTGVWNGTTIDIANGGTNATTAINARANLGLTIGSDIQAYDLGLQSISSLTTSANQMLYTTGLDTYATTSLSAYARTLIDDANATEARTTLGLGTISVLNAPTGDVVGTTDTQTLSNKSLVDNTTLFIDNGDNTKIMKFELSGISSATTRTLTIPDNNLTIVGENTTQTLTNKTITGNTNTIGATQLQTTGADVIINGSAPPTTGQVLTATSATNATWQSPTGGSSPSRNISVAQSGGDYTSIVDAINYAITLTPVNGNGVVIEIYPGTYTETNPIIIPSYVSIKGKGSVIDTTISPATSLTAAIFQMSSNSTLQNVKLSGASGVGGIGINAPSIINCVVRNILIVDCDIGFRATGSNCNLICRDCIANYMSSAPINTGFLVENSATMNIVSGFAIGNPLNNIDTGFHCRGNSSKMILNNVLANYCDTGYLIENGGVGTEASMILVSGRSDNISLYAIHIGANAIGQFSSFHIEDENRSGNDLYLSDASSVFYGNGNQIRADRIIKNINSKLVSYSISNFTGDESLDIRAELHVGDYITPRETALGNGDSYVNGMYVFTSNTPTTGFVDRTADAKDITTTFPAFNGTGVGNTLYVGGTITSYIGLVINVDTSSGLGGGTAVYEYWNGSVWTQGYYMASNREAPYLPFGMSVLDQGNYNYRFGDLTGFTTTTINGVLGWWVRVRITSTIGSIPQLQQIKLSPYRTEINKDGFIEFFGTYPKKDMRLQELGMPYQPSIDGNDQPAFLSNNLNLGIINNQFYNGSVRGFGFCFKVPYGFLSSSPLRIKITWFSDNAGGGNVVWRIRYAYTTDYNDDTSSVSSIYGYSGYPAVSPTEQSTTLTVAAPPIRKLRTTNFDLMYPNVRYARASGEGDMIFLRIERVGNNGADTHSGNINPVSVIAEYKTYCLGLFSQ